MALQKRKKRKQNNIDCEKKSKFVPNSNPLPAFNYGTDKLSQIYGAFTLARAVTGRDIVTYKQSH